MGAFSFELKQAVRRVFSWKQTGAILIPAIGLALATIMFAVGWSYSSLSLPFKDADRLVMVGYVPLQSGGAAGFGVADSYESVPSLGDDIQPFFDWKERNDVFTDIAATRQHVRGNGSDHLTVKTPNGNIRLGLRDATVNFFDVLGISFPGIQTWKTYLGTQTSVPVALPYKTGEKSFNHTDVGREFPTHEGGNMMVNGILPANFVPPTGDAYTGALGITPFELKIGDSGTIRLESGMFITRGLNVVGRLAPGVTPQLAEQMLLSSSPEIENPFSKTKRRIAVRPVTDIIAKPARPVVWGAWALGALTLVLCTANLAGLLLTRCVYRLREYAIRSALGARFSDLLRLMLMELFLLSSIAAFIAAAIAYAAMPVIAERVPVKSAAFGQPVFNSETVIFLIIATLFVAAASGIFSVVVLARNYYKSFSQGIFAVFHSHRTPRILLTVSQAAIATVLLCLSLMTVRGYLDIFLRDPGVDTGARIIEVSVSPDMPMSAIYPFAFDTLDALRGGDPNAQISLFEGRAFTGGAGAITGLRYPDGTSTWVNSMEILPGFLRILKVEFLAGRDFTEQDGEDARLINESLARQMGWPAREAVGKQFTGIYDTQALTVIGVVRDFPTTALDAVVSPMVFRQMHRGENHMFVGGVDFSFVIHQDALARAGNIERTILGFDPNAVITRNATWGKLLDDSVRGRTFATSSVTLFGIAAIAIVIAGIVSTITFIVARRMRDIAIQIALGAPPVRVCWFVMKDMLIAGVSGALAGGIASWCVGKAVAHYVYNGEKYQNLTGLAIATVIMLAIIAAAALLPALRTLRVEPGSILNKE